MLLYTYWDLHSEKPQSKFSFANRCKAIKCRVSLFPLVRKAIRPIKSRVSCFFTCEPYGKLKFSFKAGWRKQGRARVVSNYSRGPRQISKQPWSHISQLYFISFGYYLSSFAFYEAAFFQWLLFDYICFNKACHNLSRVFNLSMNTTNIIPHGKCFVRCLHTRCFVSEISLVRFAHLFDFWYATTRVQTPYAHTFHEVYYNIRVNGLNYVIRTTFSKVPYPIFLSHKWASWPQLGWKTWTRTCLKKHDTCSKQRRNYYY